MKPELRDVSQASVFGAVALALPMLFHAVGLGSAFLPMFLPLSAAGFLLPFRVAAPLAVIVPALSFVLTGMPPMIVPPIGPIMMLELGVLIGLNRWMFRTLKWNVFIAAAVSVVFDRAAYLGLLYLAATILELPRLTFSAAGLVKSLPGVILLATVVPAATKILDRSRGA